MTDSIQIDTDEFDRRTKNKWHGEKVELFCCQNCKHVFVGLSDSHLALSDPHDLSTTTPFGIPRKTKCPLCGSIWHDGKASWRTESITLMLVYLVVGLVWVRIFTIPLMRLMGRFVEARLKRLIISAGILVVLFTLAACLLSLSKSPRENIEMVFLSCLISTIPSTILWVVLEYRYGGTYQDQKKRLMK